jgi:hypothetical protein
MKKKKKSKYSEVSKMVNLFLKFIVKKLVTNHQILSQIKQATGAQNVFMCISLFTFLLDWYNILYFIPLMDFSLHEKKYIINNNEITIVHVPVLHTKPFIYM